MGTFDGFYAFLAEARGARRVVAVDNEQYRDWVRARWGVELEGGEGFRAIAELLGSEVEYRRLDAFDLDHLDEDFDSSSASGSCTGSRTRSACSGSSPAARAPVARCSWRPTGSPSRAGARRLRCEVFESGEVYARDDYVYWGFTGGSLAASPTTPGMAGWRSWTRR